MSPSRERGLLDTSTVILLGRIEDPAALPEESLAATAIAGDLPLYTCNPDDFAGIEGLAVVAVPRPDRL